MEMPSHSEKLDQELLRQIEAAVLSLRKCPLEMTLMHYSSLHRILLVGEGDFSLSSALATAFGCAENIVATSLDSRENVLRRYKSSNISISNLETCGALLLYEIDSTRMHEIGVLRGKMFDRIVFNFHHSGTFQETNKTVIQKHTDLVSMFFQSAKKLLSFNGEIHVTHKEGYPYNLWNLVEEAEKCGLILKEGVKFSITDYPGYVNKRGSGSRIDVSFHLGECKTYKFFAL